jgi:hypothetical protein
MKVPKVESKFAAVDMTTEGYAFTASAYSKLLDGNEQGKFD